LSTKLRKSKPNHKRKIKKGGW